MINNVVHCIQLRTITDADLPFLLQVYASTRLVELSATGLPFDVQMQFLESQFQLQHRHYQQHFASALFQIVIVNGQDAGRLYYGWEGDTLHLIDIALLPEFQHRGIGGILMAELMAQASKCDSNLMLRVQLQNPARNWYLKLGFVAGDHDGVYQQMHWQQLAGAIETHSTTTTITNETTNPSITVPSITT